MFEPRPERPILSLIASRPTFVRLACLALAVAACKDRERGSSADAGLDTPVPVDGGGDPGAPRPDRPEHAVPSLFDAAAPEPPPARCPTDMVLVAGRFCVDRYEASFVEQKTGQPLSPYHVPSHPAAKSLHEHWEAARTQFGGPEAQAIPLPLLPGYQRQRFEPRAVSRAGTIPQGYASGEIAARACRNAGKRLCTLDEWRTACRGEQNQQFPYGSAYAAGKCNVFREAHPAMVLHDNPSIGHSDPRLNLVRARGKPLLRRTGTTESCMSRWGDDAIADMVGNLDEWIDDPEGTFVGGFYSRSTKDGCDSIIRAHDFTYFDYSTGVRCCADLAATPAEQPLDNASRDAGVQAPRVNE